MLTAVEYAAIIEKAPVMIWRADASGACDYFNERWLRFRGRTLDEERGNGWSDGVHPDDRDGCLRLWRAHFDARSSFEMTYRLRRHDGEYRWILDTGAPISGADGEFAGFIGSCIELGDVRLELKNLRGLLSLCSWCHRVQNEEGAWQEIDGYLAEHSNIGFTHGICPTCLGKQGADAASV